MRNNKKGGGGGGAGVLWVMGRAAAVLWVYGLWVVGWSFAKMTPPPLFLSHTGKIAKISAREARQENFSSVFTEIPGIFRKFPMPGMANFYGGVPESYGLWVFLVRYGLWVMGGLATSGRGDPHPTPCSHTLRRLLVFH